MAINVIIVRTFRLESDSRTQKMVDAYKARGYHVRVVAWSRESHDPGPDYVNYYFGKGKFGSGWANFINLVGWHMFVILFLWKNRTSFDITHLVDFDTAIVGVPLSKLLGKKIVYDGFDHFASGRKWDIAKFIFKRLELILLKMSHIVILPSIKRAEQYGVSPDSISVISNIPIDQPKPIKNPTRSPGILKLAYVGTLESVHRGLEYLPQLCTLNSSIYCCVAGVGSLADFFTDCSKKLSNFEFLGEVQYSRAIEIMSDADCIFGPYLLTASHHYYAAPNKLYEHALIGNPIITNSGTPIGDFVEDHQTGFLFDGTIEGLIDLVASLSREQCEATGRRARQLWDEKLRFQREDELGLFFDRLRTLIRAGSAQSGDGV